MAAIFTTSDRSPQKWYTITSNESTTTYSTGDSTSTDCWIYLVSYEPNKDLPALSAIEQRKAQVLEWTRERENEHNLEMISSRPIRMLRAQMRRSPPRRKASKNRICRREARYRVMEK